MQGLPGGRSMDRADARFCKARYRVKLPAGGDLVVCQHPAGSVCAVLLLPENV